MVSIGRPLSAGKPFGSSSAGGKTTPGKTRTCPHCKATILESARICPACQHHLRFDPASAADQKAAATFEPLKVEGVLRHPAEGDPWEYTVVLTIRNERGEELTRQVLGVGAIQKAELRRFTLSVEVTAPSGTKYPK